MKKNIISISVVIIIIYVILGKITALFGDYIFTRVGMNRNVMLMVLWILPFMASFLITRYSIKYKVIYGLSLAILTTIISVVVNYLIGLSGYGIDFSGFNGAVELFKILFIVNIFIALIGTLSGLIFPLDPEEIS